MNEYRDGVPCSHRGCLNHITHPCEGCGRIAGKRKLYFIRFHGTENVSHEMVYDQKKEEEIESLYRLKYIANEVDLENQKLKDALTKISMYTISGRRAADYAGKVLGEIKE